jgi:hypothetical protein
MGLHWGANGFKTDTIVNRIPEGSREWHDLACGLQVDDLVALGAVRMTSPTLHISYQ